MLSNVYVYSADDLNQEKYHNCAASQYEYDPWYFHHYTFRLSSVVLIIGKLFFSET